MSEDDNNDDVRRRLDDIENQMRVLESMLPQAGLPFAFRAQGAPMAGGRIDLPAANADSRTRTWEAAISGALQVTVTAGKLYFKSVSQTITDWPTSGVIDLSDNATTWAWLLINLVTPSVTWTTGSSDPGDGDEDEEIIRVFKAVTAGGRITELLICQDFRLPGNA